MEVPGRGFSKKKGAHYWGPGEGSRIEPVCLRLGTGEFVPWGPMEKETVRLNKIGGDQ